MADMMNKWVLFLAVDGFEAKAFQKLWQCFGDLNASTRIASFNADEEINDKDGLISTHSDMSFAEASEQPADVIVIADDVTANSIVDSLAAKTAITEAFDRNAAIVSIDDGATALIAADVVNGMTIAAPSEVKGTLEEAGAQLSDEPLAVSDNIFSARSEDADLQTLCNMVSEFITGRKIEAA